MINPSAKAIQITAVVSDTRAGPEIARRRESHVPDLICSHMGHIPVAMSNLKDNNRRALRQAYRTDDAAYRCRRRCEN
jgi:hypothetical protein